MAKYCSKCGKTLPDDVEICPDCHAQEAAGNDAALFTKMTSQTEVWKEEPKPGARKKRIKKIYSMKERLSLYLGALVLVGLTAFIIIFTQPDQRVIRAIKADDYDKAITLYTEKLLGESSGADRSIGKLLNEKAQSVCAGFESGTLSEKDAETAFASIYAFGLNTDEINERYAEFGILKDNQSLLSKAERLKNTGSYLEACDIYLAVDESDASYESAQALASECLELYAQDVIASAQEHMTGKKYVLALDTLTAGNEKLKEYDAFSSDIEAKTVACCTEYEAFALSEAKNLAELEKYGDAALLLKECMDSAVGGTDALKEAYDSYAQLSEVQTSFDAVGRANEFYRNGDYAGAFKELDTAATLVEDTKTITAAMDSMEQLFAADMIAKAKNALGGKRENIDAAMEILSSALQVRQLDELSAYAEVVESYRPLDLITAVFTKREGDLYRSTAEFDSMGGKEFKDGWIWGADGSYIEYALDGKYDKLEGTFTVRRDDKASVSAHFEVWCDGELKYTSETLKHEAASYDFSYDVAECSVLRIVFVCDYNTVTGQNGYCYHGICSPRAVKNIAD